MRKLNPKAWEVLTESEKSALSIQHVMDKSSWQAGEMLGKSHYKYLEIKQRAEAFLKLFTDHYLLFKDTIPYGLDCPNSIREYLIYCIEKRYKPIAAIEKLKLDHEKINKSRINEKLIKTLNKWSQSDDLTMRHMVNLVKEFDRWNNFRILPMAIREPSAFKRRLKNTHKKHIKVLVNIPSMSISRIKKIYPPKQSEPFYYFPYLAPEPKTIKISIKPDCLNTFTGASLYVFKDDQEAKEYATLVYGYTFGGKRECTDGLKFWPLYRDSIKNAVNYNEVQNIVPNRRYLRLAMEKLEII